MTRIERVTKTLMDRGSSAFEAQRLAKEIVRNLDTYLIIQEQRQARFAALIKKGK